MVFPWLVGEWALKEMGVKVVKWSQYVHGGLFQGWLVKRRWLGSEELAAGEIIGEFSYCMMLFDRCYQV